MSLTKDDASALIALLEHPGTLGTGEIGRAAVAVLPALQAAADAAGASTADNIAASAQLQADIAKVQKDLEELS